MLTFNAALGQTVKDLRSGRLDLLFLIDEICDRIEQNEPQIQALLPEARRRERLKKEAVVLAECYPKADTRPLLYGVLVGVKDMFRVNGFSTRAGSRLDPELFVGAEAEVVALLRRAGALILGKTVTTEFAYFEPGPTRNPQNLGHTPGGSSSGSAAAVAAGFCHLALGTQTIASVVRPAVFCGVVGFKPSYDRIPTGGMIFFSPSADHVGLFTQDVDGVTLAASLLCRGWKTIGKPQGRPVLAVPEGKYLQQASAEALQAFAGQLDALRQAGCRVAAVPAFDDLEQITLAHRRLISAEMARVHADWFPRYEQLYRPRTAELICEGQGVSRKDLDDARQAQARFRRRLEILMQEAGADLWIAPSALGPAPEGIEQTGDPAMSMPWTHTGLPSITLPAGRAAGGLPLGLQLVAPFMFDEKLLYWARDLAGTLGWESGAPK